MKTREFDLIVWGATGFMGRLVCEYIFNNYKNKNIRWAIGGRNITKLESVQSEVVDSSIPIILADSYDENSISSMVSRTKVICSTVGPYSLYGSLLVDLCVKNKTHYCDITGEVQWIRKMIDLNHNMAISNKVKIVHCCGFDSIPSDMGVFFINEELSKIKKNDISRINMRVAGVKGGLSGGTYASMINILKEAHSNPNIFKILSHPYALNPKNNMEGPDIKDLRTIKYDKTSKSWIIPFLMAGINTKIVRRSNALTNYIYGKNFIYDEATLTGDGISGRIKAFLAIIPLSLISAKPGSPINKLLNYFLPKPGEGPSREKRKQGYFNLRFYIRHVDGNKSFAKVTGDMDPGYGSTSKMLAESALCLAYDKLPKSYGVLTPSVAMGNSILRRLKNKAGLDFILKIS